MGSARADMRRPARGTRGALGRVMRITAVIAVAAVALAIGHCSGCGDGGRPLAQPATNHVTPGGIPVVIPDGLEERDPVGLVRALNDLDAYAEVWRPGWVFRFRPDVPALEDFMADGGGLLGGSADFDRRVLTVAPWWLSEDFAPEVPGVETHPTRYEYWLFVLDHEVGHMLFGPCHGHAHEPGCR